MALNKREKMIAITLGIVLAGVAANSMLIKPYFTSRSDLSDQILLMSHKNDKADDVLFNRKRIGDLWKQMQTNGLKTNPSDAEIAAVNAIYSWAEGSRITIDSIKDDNPEQVGDFQQVRTTASLSGNMGGFGRWLWNLETSPLPVQLGDVRLNTKKEGTDSLNMQVTVTVLAFVPQPPKTGPGSKSNQQAGGK